MPEMPNIIQRYLYQQHYGVVTVSQLFPPMYSGLYVYQTVFAICITLQRFAAVIMRIRDPRTTALVFSSGKMVCTGAKRYPINV